MPETSRYPLKVVATENFKKDFQSLIKGDIKIENKFKRYIELLRNGRTVPGMNLEKIEGFKRIKGLKSVRLNDKIRMSIIISDKLFLLRVNLHDDLYNRPF